MTDAASGESAKRGNLACVLQSVGLPRNASRGAPAISWLSDAPEASCRRDLPKNPVDHLLQGVAGTCPSPTRSVRMLCYETYVGLHGNV